MQRKWVVSRNLPGQFGSGHRSRLTLESSPLPLSCDGQGVGGKRKEKGKMRREYTEEEMIQKRNLEYIWKCPQCDFEYNATPGTNEAQPCENCGIPCVRAGESYDA